MKITCVTSILLLIFLAGCVVPKQVGLGELLQRHRAHQPHETWAGNWTNDVWYTGSDDQFHYLSHYSTRMYREHPYKVAKEELDIAESFPRTSDRTKWRKLDMSQYSTKD